MSHDEGNPYLKQLTDREIRKGEHRDAVGGMWDEIGRLQFEFIRGRGLEPRHKLLDVGCGSLRGGVHFARYLDAGNYYGTDLNPSYLKAGLEVELPAAGLAHKKPNLLASDAFEVEKFGATFDFALAQSLFTHLPLNDIERCVVKVAAVLNPGGRFYATYFEAPPHHLDPIRHPGGIKTYSDRNPFHYHLSAFEYVAQGLPLTLRNLGDWGHPRDQKMLEFTRN